MDLEYIRMSCLELARDDWRSSPFMSDPDYSEQNYDPEDWIIRRANVYLEFVTGMGQTPTDETENSQAEAQKPAS